MPSATATDRTVAGRLVALLAAFDDPPTDRLTLTELAARTGLPLTTVHRLTGQLAGERLLERTAGGAYRVGLRLWELGLLAPRGEGLRAIAMPFLRDLSEVTRQHVQLLVLDGADAVIIDRVVVRDGVPLTKRAGGRVPAHTSSGGIVLLAFSGEAAIQAVLARPLSGFTEQSIVTERALQAALALARRQGHLELSGHIAPNAVSVSAPVMSRGRAVAAVSVIGDVDAGTDGVLPAVITAARAIGRALQVPRP